MSAPLVPSSTAVGEMAQFHAVVCRHLDADHVNGDNIAINVSLLLGKRRVAAEKLRSLV